MNKDLLSIVKDFLDEFADAYKYAELDFYKLSSEVIALLNNAKQKGYDNPVYCELFIDVVSRWETDVIIQSFYKSGNGKYRRFKRTLDLGCLRNTPTIVNNMLNKDGEVKIKLDDLQELYEVRESDIVPVIDFKELCSKASLKSPMGIPLKKELHIKDKLFYYQVFLVYLYENNEKEIRSKHYGIIINLPSEVQEKLVTSEEQACFIDITDLSY